MLQFIPEPVAREAARLRAEYDLEDAILLRDEAEADGLSAAKYQEQINKFVERLSWPEPNVYPESLAFGGHLDSKSRTR